MSLEKSRNRITLCAEGAGSSREAVMLCRNFSFFLSCTRASAFGLVAAAVQSSKKFEIEMLGGDVSGILVVKCFSGLLSLMYGGDRAVISVGSNSNGSRVDVMAESSPSFLTRAVILALLEIAVEVLLKLAVIPFAFKWISLMFYGFYFLYGLSVFSWMFAGGNAIRDLAIALERQIMAEDQEKHDQELLRKEWYQYLHSKDDKKNVDVNLKRQTLPGNLPKREGIPCCGSNADEFDAKCLTVDGEMFFKCPECGNFVRRKQGNCTCEVCKTVFEIQKERT